MRAAILVAVALLGATRADAQTFNFGAQCTSGAFQACASIELWNEVDPATGQLYLYVRAANLQGTDGFEHLQRAGMSYWSVNNLTLENYTPNGMPISSRSEIFSSFGVLAGTTFRCLSPGNCAPWTGPSVGEFIYTTQTAADRANIFDPILSDNAHVLWGCDGPETGDWIPHGWQTCGGTSTWQVQLGFGAGFRLTKDVTVAMGFVGFDDAHNSYNVQCTVGADCVTVTPEPGTMILVGSGLAALGAAARHRKIRSREQRA